MAVYLQMLYPILVSVWSLFQLRSLGLELVKHRTTPNALSFGCRLIMGLSFPLVFFYMAWIAENGINDGPWMHVDVPVLINTNATDPTDGKMIFIPGTESYYMPPSFTVFYPLATIPSSSNTFGSIYPIRYSVSVHDHLARLEPPDARQEPLLSSGSHRQRGAAIEGMGAHAL